MKLKVFAAVLSNREGLVHGFPTWYVVGNWIMELFKCKEFFETFCLLQECFLKLTPGEISFHLRIDGNRVIIKKKINYS